MLRKTIFTIGTVLGNISVASAGAFYLNPMFAYDSITTKTVSYLGYTVRLGLGYGDIVDEQIVLAGEIFAAPRAMTIHNSPVAQGGLRPQYTYGASVLPGLVLDDVFLAYARLSVLASRFNDLGLTRGGYQAGVGLEYHITKAWSARAEYVYTIYHSISGIGTPKTDEFGAGLVYRF